MIVLYDFNSETESLLLANDSTITRIRLYQKISTLSWLETIQQFSRAIAKNTVMDSLYIDVREIVQMSPTNGLDLLLQTVEESSCIKYIQIDNGFRLYNESRAFGSAILSSISRNRNIKSCRFFMTLLHSQDLSTLVRNSSITRLEFQKSAVDFNRSVGIIDSPDFDENVQELGDAFYQNTTLRNLVLNWRPMLTENNRTILEAARRSKSVVDFTVEFCQYELDEEYEPQILADVCMYVNVSKVNFVTLNYMKWDITTFTAFTSHINRKEDPIKCLSFGDCSFDKDSSVLLKEFLLENQHYIILSFRGENAAFSNEVNVLGEIIGKENGPKFLGLGNFSCISSPTNGLESICTGLASKKSELLSLNLPCLSPSQLEYFFDKVPTFKKLRSLFLSLDAESEHLKGNLFSSFSRNGCLVLLKVDAPWMTDNYSHILDRIGQRNQTLPALVQDISVGHKLPLSTIPSFFYSAAIASSGTGPKDIVAMLTMLDDKVCSPDSDDKFHLQNASSSISEMGDF